MNLNQTSRLMAITGAGLLVAAYQFSPTPSWACVASGSGFSYASQTSSSSVTVCVQSSTSSKPATSPKPVPPKATPAKPAPAPAKPAPAPAKPAPAPAKPVVVVKPAAPAPVKPAAPAKPVTQAKPAAPAKPVTPAKPAAPTVSVVTTTVSEQASFSPSPISISASDTSVNSANFVVLSVSPVLHYKSGTLLGKATDVKFIPAATAWSFGDGMGSAGANQSHRFAFTGQYVVSATVTYSVSYQISGATSWIAAGSVTSSDSLIIDVSNANNATPVNQTPAQWAFLVSQNCLANPTAYGCAG